MFTKIISLALGCMIFFVSTPAARAAEDLLCSTFPVYLFTRNVVEGSAVYSPSLMVDSQLGCPHDYAPTPADLERLSQTGVLVINGLGLDAFMTRAIRVAKNDLKVIDASGGFDAYEEGGVPEIITNKETVAGMWGHEQHDHHHHAHDHGDAPNPHIFAAPRTAAVMVNNIAEGLAVIDPGNSHLYRANAKRYTNSLADLTASFQAFGEKMNHPKIIASHGVFDYMANDLGLTVAATIEEEDGAEPSAARLAQLIKLAKEEGVKAVIVDPQGNINLARTLGAELNLPVAIIDPVAAGPADAPLDYFEKVMRTDLEILTKLFSIPEAADKK